MAPPLYLEAVSFSKVWFLASDFGLFSPLYSTLTPLVPLSLRERGKVLVREAPPLFVSP